MIELELEHEEVYELIRLIKHNIIDRQFDERLLKSALDTLESAYDDAAEADYIRRTTY
jgi:hypothetical protein